MKQFDSPVPRVHATELEKSLFARQRVHACQHPSLAQLRLVEHSEKHSEKHTGRYLPPVAARRHRVRRKATGGFTLAFREALISEIFSHFPCKDNPGADRPPTAISCIAWMQETDHERTREGRGGRTHPSTLIHRTIAVKRLVKRAPGATTSIDHALMSFITPCRVRNELGTNPARNEEEERCTLIQTRTHIHRWLASDSGSIPRRLTNGNVDKTQNRTHTPNSWIYTTYM